MECRQAHRCKAGAQATAGLGHSLFARSREGLRDRALFLLGHTKIESTVRYLGVDIEDALTLAEGTEL
jgi:hypothetical protein